MAINDDLDNSTEAARSTRIELEGIIDAVTTIGVKLQEAIADAIDDAQGLDDITETLQHLNLINEFEEGDKNIRPWIYG